MKTFKRSFFLSIMMTVAFPMSFEARGETAASGLEVLAQLQQGSENASKDHSSTEAATPRAIVVSCSDLYVPAEAIFNVKAGQILSIREVGEALGEKSLDVIESTLRRFDTKLILILGHESCEAVRTALKTPASNHLTSAKDRSIASIHSNVERFENSSTQDTVLRAPAKANVFASAKNLVKRSKVVREAIQKKGLVIAQGIYSPSTGKVEFSEDMGKVLVHLYETDALHERKPASVSKPKVSKVEKKEKAEAPKDEPKENWSSYKKSY